jgi:hypothetical protein
VGNRHYLDLPGGDLGGKLEASPRSLANEEYHEGDLPVLRGRALEIVDQRGQVRARINVEPATTMPDGKTYPEAVVFRLSGPNGRIRVKLGADQDGSGLLLVNDSQQPGVHLLAKSKENFMKVIDKDGRESVLKP